MILTDDELEAIVARLLDAFYARRVQKLDGLQLKDTLKRKNPYLFRAIGVQKASDIVEALLQAYMSSSDEGIFGDDFFEPLAKIVSDSAVASAPGVDVVIEDDRRWQELTGDADFYLRILRVMRDRPTLHKLDFERAWAAAINRFTASFVSDFCHPDGSIDWETLLRFNSAAR